MFLKLLRIFISRQRLLKPREYERGLQRYRHEHPESLEKERGQIQRWIKYVDARNRREQQNNTQNRKPAGEEEEARVTDALYAMREVARTAFMRHPASTEYDFQRCWPSIRKEILKQWALEELASNPALSSRLARLSEEGVTSSARQSGNSNLVKGSRQTQHPVA